MWIKQKVFSNKLNFRYYVYCVAEWSHFEFHQMLCIEKEGTFWQGAIFFVSEWQNLVKTRQNVRTHYNIVPEYKNVRDSKITESLV